MKKIKRLPRRAAQKSHTPRPGASAEGTIGQGIGRLPSKNSTPHIAKEPLPEGAVNAKGQKKITDAAGKVRFVNMREPRVMGPGGVPVKG